MEEVASERALAWVRERNAETLTRLQSGDEYRRLRERILAIHDSVERVPRVVKHGAYYYNFWRDAEHPRGILRRTDLDSYRTSAPLWEAILDVDALAASENESWAFAGTVWLPPDYDRCLIRLSRGGADAVVTREFDIAARTFVTDGFFIPESKSIVDWIDRDTLLVADNLDPESRTESGYPRVVKEWRRGTDLATAIPVLEGEKTDVRVMGQVDHAPGFERIYLERHKTFFTSRLYLRHRGELREVEKPEDAEGFFFRDWFVIGLRSSWKVGSERFPAGSLVGAKLEDWLAGKADLRPLFQPTAGSSLTRIQQTRSHLLA
ncbi:MAG: S9 family peptidase, partial [Candidatus Eisenbacteria bacterium]|nr:S9 family peptidase [Candidatus Eisenbacteria bacterium]